MMVAMLVALHLWLYQFQFLTLFNSNLFARTDQFKKVTSTHRLLRPVTDFGRQIMLLPNLSCHYGL